MRHALSILLAAVTMFAVPARAQSPSPEVVVTAPTDDVLERFVRDLTDPARTAQIPRWEREICPGIVGLPPAQAVVLNDRIEQVAAIAKLSHGQPGCRPNILVLFSTDAAKLAAGIARRFPITLGAEGRVRLRRFAETHAPVRWISHTDIGTANGEPMIRDNGARSAIGRMSGSRIKQSTRAVIGFMLVIVDGAELNGITLGDLGDYLGIVAIARPPLDRAAPRDSALSVFTGRGAGGLTDRDRSYLTALYAAPAAGSAQTQRSAIRSGMRRDEKQPRLP